MGIVALIICVVPTDGVARVRQQHLFRRSASLVLCHSAGLISPSRSDLVVFELHLGSIQITPLFLQQPVSGSVLLELCATW